MAIDNQELVIKAIKERACVKRDVYENLLKQFESLKAVVQNYASELEETIGGMDKRLEVKFEEKSKYQFNLTIAGDIIIFYMHSNVFQFPHSHHAWKTSYVKEDESRSFTGSILIYNFLADSFRLKRLNDIGDMIARVFVDRDDHFLVDGQKELGYKYNNYVNGVLTPDTWKSILESALLFAMDFNLFIPPYQAVNMATVHNIMELGNRHGPTTGKRFGFQFYKEDEVGDKVS